MGRNINTKVLIVDEHPLFCMGLSSLLKSHNKFNIVGTATNSSDALTIAEKEHPSLITLEIHLGNENGLELIKDLKSMNQEVAILVISVQNERFYSERILRLGARGYIMKDSPANRILEAVLTVLDGRVYLSESERERLFQAMTEDSARGIKDWTSAIHKLSDRELQVFSMIGKGYGTIEISSNFGLSTKTIDTYKEHIKTKLHCNTSLELRQFAIEWANQSVI